MKRTSQPVVLSIAGSDSGGSAGIQADLKTFATLGCFGTTAITAITAQNPDGIAAVEPVSPRMVALQIKAVTEAFPIAAAKTGMLFSAPMIKAVTKALVAYPVPVLVIDPVMIATSGARLLKHDAGDALHSLLLKATVLTPNVPEAEALCGKRIKTLADMKDAARLLGTMFHTSCVVKGGHLPGAISGKVANVLYSHVKTTVFTTKRLRVAETHGSGCTFSAALTALLAQGHTLEEAVRKAQDFVANAMRHPIHAGHHRPLNVSRPN